MLGESFPLPLEPSSWDTMVSEVPGFWIPDSSVGIFIEVVGVAVVVVFFVASGVDVVGVGVVVVVSVASGVDVVDVGGGSNVVVISVVDVCLSIVVVIVVVTVTGPSGCGVFTG